MLGKVVRLKKRIIGISIGSLHRISNFSMETSCEQQLLFLNSFLQKLRFFFPSLTMGNNAGGNRFNERGRKNC